MNSINVYDWLDQCPAKVCIGGRPYPKRGYKIEPDCTGIEAIGEIALALDEDADVHITVAVENSQEVLVLEYTEGLGLLKSLPPFENTVWVRHNYHPNNANIPMQTQILIHAQALLGFEPMDYYQLRRDVSRLEKVYAGVHYESI